MPGALFLVLGCESELAQRYAAHPSTKLKVQSTFCGQANSLRYRECFMKK
jgi:hypothetical protein